MKKTKIYYFFLTMAIIFLGILSRKIEIRPFCFGDLLYAVMIYCIIRIVFTDYKAIYVVLFSLLTCYGIELLQLYQAEWIVELRKTLFGRYVLGQGFLWSDIFAYTFGGAIAFFIEKIVLKYNTNQG